MENLHFWLFHAHKFQIFLNYIFNFQEERSRRSKDQGESFLNIFHEYLPKYSFKCRHIPQRAKRKMFPPFSRLKAAPANE